jgi:two-component system chemotaxis response regulator CheV
MGERAHSDKPILLADDSIALNKILVESLTRAGYSNLTMLQNGQELWESLQAYKATGRPIGDFCKLVITDIEMPKMDGMRLLKLIKEDDDLKHLPVIIFSSIITDANRHKGESLGAVAQLTKPEIAKLVELVDAYILP